MAKCKVIDLKNPVCVNGPYGVYSRYSEYLNLLMNSVKIIDNETQEQTNFAEERFVKEALFVRGGVGYDKLSKKWYYAFGTGINNYGDPTRVHFVSANGKELFVRNACYDKKDTGAYYIYALPTDYMTIADLIKETTDFMTNCDVALRQNLEACKTPYIVVCKNKELQLSFEQALQQKQDGQAVVVVSAELGEGLRAVDIGVDYLVDKFMEVRDRERDTLLNKLGILTSNVNKKERVQSAEVNATIDEASDYIYLIIDTFNKQMESYGLPFEMQFNGSMEEIYLSEDEAEEVDDVNVNDVESEQEIND